MHTVLRLLAAALDKGTLTSGFGAKGLKHAGLDLMLSHPVSVCSN